MTGSPAAAPPDSRETVEQIVRGQLARALGGRRGMVEAAVPTLLFTVLWLSTRELPLALSLSAVSAVVMLLVRLVQRSTLQYCLNALVGIGIGWLFVHLAARGGGDADDQALAYFLPGLIYNAAYTVLLAVSTLVRWPVVGFMIGSVTGDPTAWRQDRQVVALCSRLTWLLALPCLVRVAVQAPIWLAAHAGTVAPGTAVGLLGVIFLGHVVALLPAAARATVTMDGDRIVALESWFLTVRDCLLMPGTASVAGCEVAAPVALLVPGRSESWGVVEPGQVVRVRRGPMLLCSIAMGLPSPWCAIAAPSEGGTYLLPRDGKRLTRI